MSTNHCSVSCRRIFCDTGYRFAVDNDKLLTAAEADKISKYDGKIDAVNNFSPAIYNEHGRSGPMATIHRLAVMAVHDYAPFDDGDGPTRATRLNISRSRFEAIISIHLARCMARELSRGATGSWDVHN